MNICPVCRNVNNPDATVCRYCQTALTPPPPPVAHLAAGPRPRRWPWIAGAVVAVLVLGLIGGGILGSTSGTEAAAATTVDVSTGSGASLEFAPKSIEAPANSPIALTFNNQASLAHNLTFQGGINDATSPSVAGGTSETINFQTPGPGTYKFVCTIHPGMEGTLTVK